MVNQPFTAEIGGSLIKAPGSSATTSRYLYIKHDITETKMLYLPLVRHSTRYAVVKLGRVGYGGHASYSALQSSLKISSIPAPHAGSITVVSLNRPQARNAISKQLLSELSSVVDGLHREGGKGSTRAMILASESDQAFCAGADLKERVDMSPEE